MAAQVWPAVSFRCSTLIGECLSEQSRRFGVQASLPKSRPSRIPEYYLGALERIEPSGDGFHNGLVIRESVMRQLGEDDYGASAVG